MVPRCIDITAIYEVGGGGDEGKKGEKEREEGSKRRKAFIILKKMHFTAWESQCYSPKYIIGTKFITCMQSRSYDYSQLH